MFGHHRVLCRAVARRRNGATQAAAHCYRRSFGRFVAARYPCGRVGLVEDRSTEKQRLVLDREIEQGRDKGLGR